MESNNFIFRNGSDLDTILEQISRVSPLLSPIVTHYSIKLRNNSLKKLVDKFCSQNEQQNEKQQEGKSEVINGMYFNFFSIHPF